MLQPLVTEIKDTLSGSAPDAAITLEDLARMPQLQAFTREVAS